MRRISRLPVVLTVLGQATDTAGGTDSASSVRIQSILDFVLKGGPMMIPIGECAG